MPDQRGYNLSDQPRGIANYDLDQLAVDIIGLADYFGRETFAVVGHDWGASVGWWLAGQYRDRVQKLAVLNAPHAAVGMEAMRNNPAQKRKSSYVRFFQIAYLPELLISPEPLESARKRFPGQHAAGAFTNSDLKEYQNAWSQPGALAATASLLPGIVAEASGARRGVPHFLSHAGDLGKA